MNTRVEQPRARPVATAVVAVACGALAACGPDEDLAAPPQVDEATINALFEGKLVSALEPRELITAEAGDLITVEGLDLEVPQAGETLTVSSTYTDQPARTIVLSNDPGGRVVLSRTRFVPPAEPPPQERTIMAISQCSDSYHYFQGYQPGDVGWYYNGSAAPSLIAGSGKLGAIKRGASNITGVRNSCGIPDHMNRGQHYLGKTGRNASLRDHVNVVSWGWQPAGVLAVTYYWVNSAKIISEADIRITNREFWGVGISGCSNDRFGGWYDLENTVTHEWGHVWGLGDVYGASHKNLTMYGYAKVCSTKRRTLGRGESSGLNIVY